MNFVKIVCHLLTSVDRHFVVKVPLFTRSKFSQIYTSAACFSCENVNAKQESLVTQYVQVENWQANKQKRPKTALLFKQKNAKKKKRRIYKTLFWKLLLGHFGWLQVNSVLYIYICIFIFIFMKNTYTKYMRMCIACLLLRALSAATLWSSGNANESVAPSSPQLMTLLMKTTMLPLAKVAILFVNAAYINIYQDQGVAIFIFYCLLWFVINLIQ